MSKDKLTKEEKHLLTEYMEKHPFLWDAQNVEYKNEVKKELCWEELSKMLGDKDVEFLKLRWKHIRENQKKKEKKRKNLIGLERNTIENLFVRTDDFVAPSQLVNSSISPCPSTSSSFTAPQNDISDEYMAMKHKGPMARSEIFKKRLSLCGEEFERLPEDLQVKCQREVLKSFSEIFCRYEDLALTRKNQNK